MVLRVERIEGGTMDLRVLRQAGGIIEHDVRPFYRQIEIGEKIGGAGLDLPI
jgi:hypothetical protein